MAGEARAVTDTAIPVVLVGAQRLVRDALKAMLSLETNIRVMGEATSVSEAVEITKTLHPTALVLDIPTSDTRGIDAIAQLLADCPGLRIAALTEHYDPYIFDLLLKRGVSGYVLKSDPGTELARAIRVIAQEKFFFSPDVATSLARGHGAPEAERKPAVEVLGPRERQVLALIAEGRRSQEIARRLHVSVATVEVHRRNIIRKLDLHSIAELTKYAIRERLIQLD
jgi:DNA-binding NarL/FixJ family response regulator